MSSLNTRVLTVDPAHPSPEAIRAAADVLLSGGLVAFPTETVYGLGANALDAAAVSRIFEAKGRPASDPVIVHIASTAQLSSVALHIPEIVQRLASEFWPGPLTLVLERAPVVPENVSANRPTIAVRLPRHLIPQALIEASGVPIAAPSANLFARPSPTTAQHVLEDLEGRIDLVLDGGPTSIGLESTVIDLTQDPPLLLRPGGTPFETLRRVLPELELDPKFLPAGGVGEGLPAPGMLPRHYAPRAQLLLFSGPGLSTLAHMRQVARERVTAGEIVGALIRDEDSPAFEGIAVQLAPLGPSADLAQVGRNLFAGLRDLDRRGVDVILVRAKRDQAGLGLAIWDRLLRAAEGQVIAVSEDGSVRTVQEF